jgi:Chlororespiratory reduction 6
MNSGSYDDEDQAELYGLQVGANDSDGPSMIIYTALRNEVMAGDLNGIRKVVEKNLLRTPETARRSFQSLMFYIQEYDDDPRELYHIAECRSWFQSIDRKYPFLIYFIPCLQYTLYVGSQQNMDGSRLSMTDLWSFFKERDRALQQLAQRIGEPYRVMKENLRRAFRDYSQMDLKPW